MLYSQQTIPAGGGNASGTGGSVSYTVGQIACSSVSDNSGAITQGVQQPYEISVVTAIANTEGIEAKIFPNPTNGKVKLVFGSFDNGNLRFRLFDSNGVLLQDKKIEDRETEIPMDNLSGAVYFLKVISNNNEVKVFKIVKY